MDGWAWFEHFDGMEIVFLEALVGHNKQFEWMSLIESTLGFYIFFHNSLKPSFYWFDIYMRCEVNLRFIKYEHWLQR